ncbi:MAG: hypothetical protein ABL958_05840 [Bdellovibrionia bacterium]
MGKGSVGVFFILFLIVFVAFQNCGGFKAIDEASNSDNSVIYKTFRLSPAGTYARCYALLVRARVPASDAGLVAVKAGSKSAVSACMDLVAKADFALTGQLAAPNDPIALAVLKTMNDFHRQWFPVDVIEDSVPADGRLWAAMAEAQDMSEMGLHITRALLMPGAKYSDVVTRSTTLRTQRRPAAGNTAILGANEFDFMRINLIVGPLLPGKTYPEPDAFADWPNQSVVPRGQLFGVTDQQAMILPGFPGVPNTNINNFPQFLSPAAFDVHLNNGGGVLGSPSYLMLNFGRKLGDHSDGGANMPRRWAKAVLNDILCRDLPAIRLGDASPRVQSASPVSFRKGLSCMQCHSTMDPIAATARNFEFVHSAQMDGGIDDRGTINLRPIPPTMSAAEIQPVNPDPDYYLRPAQGYLYYRSYDGSLVDQAVMGMADLGSKIAAGNDLYACAAKKYYFYFTGAQVSLQDIGDATKPELNSADIKRRDFVIDLGQKLKTDQSLKNLMRAIFESAAFQDSGYGGAE